MLLVELLDDIVSRVEDKHDLCTLCLTSRLFFDLSQRYLYRVLDLDESKRIIKLCHLLVQQPVLAKLVRSLEVTLCEDYVEAGVDDNPGRLHWEGMLGPAYIRLFLRALHAMPNLKRLKFHHPLCFPWDLVDRNLANCSFRLEALTLPQETELGGLMIQRQRSLMELTIHRETVVKEEFATIVNREGNALLPNLWRLEAPWNVVYMLVPTRAIKWIYPRGHEGTGSLQRDLAALSPSAGHLQYLCLHSNYFFGPFQTLAPHFQFLSELAVYACDITGSEAAPRFGSLGPSYHAMTSLRKFRLYFRRWDTFSDDQVRIMAHLEVVWPSLGHMLFRTFIWDSQSFTVVCYAKKAGDLWERYEGFDAQTFGEDFNIL